jgi:DNA-binding response OmpR family regulator
MPEFSVPQSLKERYLLRLQAALPDLENYNLLCVAGGGSQDVQEHLSKLSHKLAGSGYTLGYLDVSAVAAELEAALESLPPFAPAAGVCALKLLEACNAAILTSPRVEVGPALAQIVAIHNDPETGRLITAAFGPDTPVSMFGSWQDASQQLRDSQVKLAIADLDNCSSDVIGQIFAATTALNIPLLTLASSRRQAAIIHALSNGRTKTLAKGVDPAELAALANALAGQKTRSVLLGDDDEIVREFLKSRFEAQGLQVISASDGEQVILEARRQKPSIIVLDRTMPKFEGLTVLSVLKTDPATYDIPVLMLTQKARPEHIKEGLALGASDYMIKPFSPDAVVARCLEILNGMLRGQDRRNIFNSGFDGIERRTLVGTGRDN